MIDALQRNAWSHRALAVTALLACAALLAGPTPADAAKGKRFGIEGKFVSYDQANQTFKVYVISRSAPGFGGSTVGGKAPRDLNEREEIEFAVKPDGSVLSRTVIKSARGTGLDNSGTQEGFSKAVRTIPTDRPLAFSIEKNTKDSPAYRIKTVVIQMTEEELRRRWEEITQDP